MNLALEAGKNAREGVTPPGVAETAPTPKIGIPAAAGNGIPETVRVFVGHGIVGAPGSMGRQRYQLTLDGEPLDKPVRSPLYDGARLLLTAGYHPDTVIETASEDAPDKWLMRGVIGRLAEWTVSESDRSGLRRHKWAPYPGREEDEL